MSKFLPIPIQSELKQSLDPIQRVAALDSQMVVVARNFQELSKRLITSRNIANTAIQKRHLAGEVSTLLLPGSGFVQQVFNILKAGPGISITKTAALITIGGVVFGASGSGHGPGIVPDPGAAGGTSRFLREDATWRIPAFVPNVASILTLDPVPYSPMARQLVVDPKFLTLTDTGAGNFAFLSGGANLLSGFHRDTLAAAVTRGDVIIGNSTPAWSRLGIGTSGQVLGSNGTDVSWITPASAGPGGTSGAVQYNSAGAFGGSAIGTTGQALVSGNTGAPTWFAPTAGSIIFAGASGILAQNNPQLFWDNTNNRLGIGTAIPSQSVVMLVGNVLIGTNSIADFFSVTGKVFGFIANGNQENVSEIANQTDGTAASCGFIAEQGTGATLVRMQAHAHSTSNTTTPGTAVFVGSGAGMVYVAVGTETLTPLIFWVNHLEQARFDSTAGFGRLLINTTLATLTTTLLECRKDANAAAQAIIENRTLGTSARCNFHLRQDTGAVIASIDAFSASYTTSGMFQAGSAVFYEAGSSVTAMNVGCYDPVPLSLWTGNTKAFTIDANQIFISAAAFSTTMTKGFINIPGAGGAPTGVPATTTGFPLYWDSTNFQLYVFSGGVWKKSAAFT